MTEPNAARPQARVRGRAPLAIAAVGVAGCLLAAGCGRETASVPEAGAGATSVVIGGAPTTLPPATTEPETTTTTEPPSSSTTASTVAPTSSTTTTAAPVTTSARGAGVPARLPAPGPLLVLGGTSIPDAGQWRPIGPTVGGTPAMYGAQYPTRPGSPIGVGVAWIDPGAIRTQFQPGTTDPPGQWSTPPFVKPEWLPTLAAAFNGGFKSKDSRGGMFLDGREASGLKPGAASAVIDADGVLTVGQWGRDVGMNDRVIAVRQNLELIVDNHQVNPRIKPGDTYEFGATLNNVPDVPRSAVGVRPDGAIIYAGGPGLGALDIANVMLSAGCVRAMELDINPSWVTFNFYNWNAATNAAEGQKLTGAMVRAENRFLVADDRDFFSLFVRT